MTVHRQTRERTAALLWDLKLRGDVEDDEGQATGILRERLMTHALGAFASSLEVRSTLNSCKVTKKVHAITRGTKTFAIRLALADADMPPNPYDDEPAVEVLSNHTGLPAADTFSEWRTWPITQRLALVKAVTESLNDDMLRYKNGVLDGL